MPDENRNRHPPKAAVSDATIHSPRPQFGPAIAAWLLPGLGHVLIGQRRRGYVLMTVILSLWVGGLLIGGVTVIDRVHRETGQRNWWYIGQCLLAPSVAVDTLHQFLKRTQPKPEPAFEGERRPLYEPAYGSPMEQGTLYTALAGLLNLLCILDVCYCDPQARQRRERAAATSSAVGEHA